MPSTNVTTTPAEAVPPNRRRRALIIQNNGTENIIFAFRANVTASGADAGLILTPGESFTVGTLPRSGYDVATPALHAVAASGTQQLRWEEL
ncbi:MAG: hypothetical protein JJU00_19975 [Opitutales bacterium]|nr:hypothetical protein [Opitutales bacterium]